MGGRALVFSQNARQLVKGCNEYSVLNDLIKLMFMKANLKCIIMYLFIQLYYIHFKVANEDLYTKMIMA